MKNIINFFLIMFITLFLNACCGYKKLVQQSNILGVSMKNELVINNGTTYQVDSLIIADTLPSLNKWLGTTFMDETTQVKTIKRMYIKKYSKTHEVVYVITGIEEPFKIIKRRTK